MAKEFSNMENVFDVRLSSVIGNDSVITRERHKDGVVCIRVSFTAVDPASKALVKKHETIWPRNEVLGDEMASCPLILADAIIRYGVYHDEETGEIRVGKKYLALYDKEGNEYAPAGEKREFQGEVGDESEEGE